MNYLLRRITSAGVRRGLGGGHWSWLLLAAGAFALRRSRQTGDPVVLAVPAKLGDRLLVTLREPEPRRRAGRRAPDA